MACGSCGGGSGPIRVARSQSVPTAVIVQRTANIQQAVIEKPKTTRVLKGVRSARDVDRFRDQ